MVTVLCGAVLMATDGVMSLVADRDVVAEPDAGPLVGPAMAIAALAVLFLSLLGGLRPSPRAPSVPVARAIVASGLVWVLGPAVGAIAYSLGQEQPLSGLLFFSRHLVSPFTIASAAIVLLAVLLLPLLSTARSGAGEGGSPRRT